MAKRRRECWLLIRVAAQNIERRPMRAVLLGVAVMLGVGVGFATFVAGWSLRAGIATSLSRMGADLVVVPRETLVNITSSLLTVQPTDASLDASMAETLSAIPGVARVAPQRIVQAMIDGHVANLIAFDPASDFSILPWLGEHQPEPLNKDDVIAGNRVPVHVGTPLQICGKFLIVRGRLEQTGVGPFDQSYFLSFDTLATINAFNYVGGSQTGEKAPAPANAVNGAAAPPAETNAEADNCKTEWPLNRVSAYLLQLSPGARVEDVKFSIAQLPAVRIVESNAVLTSSRQALSPLFLGIIVFTAFQGMALMIVVSLLFSAIVQERYREVGLLKAMGARGNQIMTIILAESAIITGLGGLAGLAFGTTLLLLFARSLGFYFGLLGIPFSWPPLAVLQMSAVASVMFSAFVGLVGAFLPAWRVRGLDPYALIQTQER